MPVIKLARMMTVMLTCLPLLANAVGMVDENTVDGVTSPKVRLGTRLNLNEVGEITDAPWGVYADRIGFGATLSFDVSYRLSNFFALHSAVGLDYRYFSSEYQEIGLECDCERGGFWSGYNRDYLLYLEVPLLAQAHIPNIIYFEAGPVFDFLLMRKSSFYLPKNIRTDKCHDDRFFGAGLSVGIGHEFSFGLFVDAHLTFQLTDVVTVDKTCGSYTISWGSSRLDNESGKETVEKNEYIDESIVGSYYLFHKIQLGVGYWF